MRRVAARYWPPVTAIRRPSAGRLMSGFGRCGICGPARRTPRRAARRTAFSFKSTPSDDLPSRVIRSAQQGVDPRGYSQMMRRAEQLGPQKLPSQVTRRAATARAVLPSGARPAFRQSK